MSTTKPILRCQHIKVDGVQCGSPALRGERRCYFHDRWQRVDQGKDPYRALGSGVLPALEDANSIQLALAEVMRLAICGHIEYRVFALLLRALRIAAANVRHLSPTPQPTHIVIDPESVENRPLGASAWSQTEGQDYDMIDTTDLRRNDRPTNDLPTNDRPTNDLPRQPTSHPPKPEKSAPKISADDFACVKQYERLVAGVARDPDFLNKPYEDEANSAPGEIVLNRRNQPFHDAGAAQESPTS
jgi:hypothetical protein